MDYSTLFIINTLHNTKERPKKESVTSKNNQIILGMKSKVKFYKQKMYITHTKKTFGYPSSSSSQKTNQNAHLGPAHADDAVRMPVGIIKERNGDRVLAGRNPVAFGGGIDLEHVSS